jgi:hypothetical protein
MTKLEIIKQLEYLTAFQADCLTKGDWDSFDKAEEEIKRLEKAIVAWQEGNMASTA